MKYSKIQSAVGLLIAAVCVITAKPACGSEFWLRTGTTTNTMPDGRQVVMWGFAKDSSATVQDGTITVPGPELGVVAGDSLTIHVTNSLPEPVSIVVPGLYSYDSLDATFRSGGAYAGRVRSLTREAAASGGTATYTWTSVTNGTYLYHSGSHPAVQVQMGLYGALTVRSAGPQVYAGVPYNSSVTLLFSEIDPEVHDAVSGSSFGPGPSFLAGDFTDATAAAFFAAIQASADPVAQFLYDQVTNANQGLPPANAGELTSALNVAVGDSSIYTPDLFPDETILSDPTIALLIEAPEVNQPLVDNHFNGTMVRLNRLLLQDGLANAGISGLPAVKAMTSTIRSYPQYFLVNGLPYTATRPIINPGAAGTTILLSMLNAGMDAHVPTLNNGGDLQLVGEDGQQAPYVRNTAVVWMPALKTVDALWTPASAGTYAVYDRRLGLVNGLQAGGGMLVKLKVTPPLALTPTTILVQPSSQTVNEAATATFRVVASGSGLTYQWQRNSVNIAGATAANYSLPNVTIAADNGAQFRVVVSGTGGPSVTSPNALLTVTLAAPIITTQPLMHSNTPPAVTSFSVVATGSPTLTYLWSKGSMVSGPFVPLANNAHISGATASTLNLLTPTTAADAGFYQVVVTGPGGSATSVAAELRTPPGIITQPANQSVAVTAPATYSVVAAGTPPSTYQWQRRGSAAGSFAAIAGATGSSYTLPHTLVTDNGAQFRVVVSGLLTPPVTSGNATLTVNNVTTPLFIDQQPTDLSLDAGNAGSFTVVAYGFPNPTYQWQRFVGSTWQPLVGTIATGFSGANTATLSISGLNMNVARAGSFRVVVSNSSGSVTSAVAALTVKQSFVGTPVLNIPLAGGTSLPYPAPVPLPLLGASVPGLTGAEIRHASVSLTLSHDQPWDVTAMLVSPGPAASARKVVFMSGLGPVPTEITTVLAPELGLINQYGVNNCSLTFDDSAPAPVRTNYWLTSGTYQPSVHPQKLPLPPMPAPAPGLPYPRTFSALNGLTAAGGQWNLFVNDDQDTVTLGTPIGSNGRILLWTLTLTAGPLGGPLPPALPLDPPQTPTNISPGGPAPGLAVNTLTPTYTWTTVPGATRYQIVLRTVSNGAYSYLPWLTSAQVDPGNTGTAHYIQPTPLVPGTYIWALVAGNAAGNSHFSGDLAFATPGAGVVSPTQPISPNGATTATPTYTFSLTPQAQQYQILVTSVPSGVQTVLGAFQTVNLAGGTIPLTGTYNVVQPTPLASGNYTWILQTELGGGWVWSYPMNFSVP